MTAYLIKTELGTFELVPEPELIHELLSAVAADDLSFLVVQRTDSPQWWIQAFPDAEGLCLEHRAGGADAQFESRGVTVDQAQAAVMSWTMGSAECQVSVTWQRAERS